MFDFLVKNASLPDGREGIDIACKNGLITNVEKNISAEAKETIDARNNYENLVYQMKTTLNDEKMASLIDETMKTDLTKIIDESTSWLDSNTMASKEEYESRLKEFQEAMKPLQETRSTRKKSKKEKIIKDDKVSNNTRYIYLRGVF